MLYAYHCYRNLSQRLDLNITLVSSTQKIVLVKYNHKNNRELLLIEKHFIKLSVCVKYKSSTLNCLKKKKTNKIKLQRKGEGGTKFGLT